MPPPEPGRLPERLPLFPLSNTVLFPRDRIVIQAFEPRYVQLIDDALAASRVFGVIQPSRDGIPHPLPDDCSLYAVGGAAYIQAFQETDDARYLLQLTGVSRFRVRSETGMQGGYRRADVDWRAFAADVQPADCRAINRKELLAALIRHTRAHELAVDWDRHKRDPTETLLHFGIRICRLDSREKQGMLEAEGVVERARMLRASLAMKEAERSGSGSGSIN